MLLKTIINNIVNEHGGDYLFNTMEENMEIARKVLFPVYPLWGETDEERNYYKELIEVSILSTYYNENIGFDTFGMFRVRLNMFMKQYMPTYNRLYSIEMKDYDPLKNIDYTETYQEDNLRVNKIDTTTNSTETFEQKQQDDFKSKMIGLEHPAQLIDIYDDNLDHANNGNISLGTNNKDLTSDNVNHVDVEKDENRTHEKDYTLHKTGKIGINSYASIIKEFRQQQFNTIEILLDDIGSRLFMNIIK